MTDFMKINQYTATTNNAHTNTKFNNNIKQAIQACAPMKSKLSKIEFRHLVLYVLIQRTKNE